MTPHSWALDRVETVRDLDGPRRVQVWRCWRCGASFRVPDHDQRRAPRAGFPSGAYLDNNCRWIAEDCDLQVVGQVTAS